MAEDMTDISIKLFSEPPSPASALQDDAESKDANKLSTPQASAPHTPQAASNAQDPAPGLASTAPPSLAASTPTKPTHSGETLPRRKTRGVISPPPFSLPASPEDAAAAATAARSIQSSGARSAPLSGSARRRSTAHRQMAAALGAVPRSFDFDDLVASSAASAALARAKALHKARMQHVHKEHKQEQVAHVASPSVQEDTAASPVSSAASDADVEGPSPPFLQAGGGSAESPQSPEALQPPLAAVQAESPDTPPPSSVDSPAQPPTASAPAHSQLSEAAATPPPHASPASPQRSQAELLARGLPLRPKSLSPQRSTSALPGAGAGSRPRGGALQVSAHTAAPAAATTGGSAAWGAGGAACSALAPSPTSSEEDAMLARFMDTPESKAATTPPKSQDSTAPCTPQAHGSALRTPQAPWAPVHAPDIHSAQSDAGSSSPDLSPVLARQLPPMDDVPLLPAAASPPSTPQSMNELLAARAERRRLQRGWSPSRGAPSSVQGIHPIRTLDLGSTTSPGRGLSAVSALDRAYQSTAVSTYSTASSTTICLATQGDSSDSDEDTPPASPQQVASLRRGSSSVGRRLAPSSKAQPPRGSRELRRLMQDLAWHGPTIAAAGQRTGSASSARDARRKSASAGKPSVLELVASAAMAQGKAHRYSVQCTDEVQRMLQQAVAAECDTEDSGVSSADDGGDGDCSPPPALPRAGRHPAGKQNEPQASTAQPKRGQKRVRTDDALEPAPATVQARKQARGAYAASKAGGAPVPNSSAAPKARRRQNKPMPAKRRPVRAAVLKRDEFAQRDAFLGTFPSRGGVVP